MKRKKTIAEVLAQTNEKSAQLHKDLLKELDRRENIFRQPSIASITASINRLVDSLDGYARKSARRSNETLAALRNYDTAMSSCADVYRRLLRAIDGSPMDILIRGKHGTTSDDHFIQAIYDAMTQTSIRKWTRDHLELIKSAVAERESIRRKIGKLEKMAHGETPEAKTAAAKKREFSKVDKALSCRIATVVRKFLQIRQIALKAIVGTTESIFATLGNEIPYATVARYNTEEITAELAAADRKATDRRRA